jgi:hypothetical protein
LFTYVLKKQKPKKSQKKNRKKKQKQTKEAAMRRRSRTTCRAARGDRRAEIRGLGATNRRRQIKVRRALYCFGKVYVCFFALFI